MSVRYEVGDTREVVATLPDGSVSLVASSPPFIALRSYLPADHEHKHAEIGSEPDPATFLDTLLELTAEWGRVLAPWGSIAIELGDTYAGSGGAGGDYGADGWRAGQAKFRQSSGVTGTSAWTYPDALWLAALIDAEGAIYVSVDKRDTTDRYSAAVAVGMNGRAMLDKAAQITGVGSVRAADGGFKWAVHSQQARYVLLNIWPHLMVKQEQAKAAIELARHAEEGRYGNGRPVPSEAIEYRETIRRFIMNLNEKGGNHGKYPGDWTPPTPHKIEHPMRLNPGWSRPKSLALIPQLYATSLAYGRNLLTGQPSPAGQWLVRNVIVWHRPNPAVGALGDKVRPSTSYITVATRSAKRWFDLDAVRSTGPTNPTPRAGWKEIANPDRMTNTMGTGDNPAGAPPLDCWFDQHDTWTITTQPSSLAHYAMWPARLAERLILMMCPAEVCATCGTPRRRLTGPAEYVNSRTGKAPTTLHFRDGEHRPGQGNTVDSGGQGDRAALRVAPTLGWSDCGCGAGFVPGVVLDPFAGTGTTLAVADLHGRDAIGIDLDERNRDLYPRRRDECARALFDVRPQMTGQLDMFSEALL